MAEKEAHPDPHHASALKVNKGIDQPSSINENAASAYKNRKKQSLDESSFVDGILRGDRVILSKAITLIESSLPEHFALSQSIIEKCMPHSGNALRVGVTGVPGVGKSTFIEALGKHLTAKGHMLAVLAVDPSSQVSGGSILGDKTRMETLAVDKNAYVRPSPSAGSLGGVTRKTRDIIILCEAAGFNIIFIETVGVGQSEVAVHSMVDFFLLLMLAGAGDELQGIKRGIIEMCDGMVINKADGDNIHKAKMARLQYQTALHLFPPLPSGWKPKVMICSSLAKTGIDKIWAMIKSHEALMKKNGQFQIKRDKQQKSRMFETIHESLYNHFYRNPEVVRQLPEILRLLSKSQITSFQAAQQLLNNYFRYLDGSSPKTD